MPISCGSSGARRSEEHTSELQSQSKLVCRLLLEKKKRVTPVPTFLMVTAASGNGPPFSSVMRPESVAPETWARVGVAEKKAKAIVFFNQTPTTKIYTLSLHDALPI